MNQEAVWYWYVELNIKRELQICLAFILHIFFIKLLTSCLFIYLGNLHLTNKSQCLKPFSLLLICVWSYVSEQLFGLFFDRKAFLFWSLKSRLLAKYSNLSTLGLLCSEAMQVPVLPPSSFLQALYICPCFSFLVVPLLFLPPGWIPRLGQIWLKLHKESFEQLNPPDWITLVRTGQNCIVLLKNQQLRLSGYLRSGYYHCEDS